MTEQIEQFKQIEQEIMKIVDELVEDVAIWRKFFHYVKLSDKGQKFYRYYRMVESNENIAPSDFDFFPSKEVKIPLFSKGFRLYRNGKLNIAEIQRATREILEDEGKLILTGEHEGWQALGIHGLATDPQRKTHTSKGRWPEYAIPDIHSAQAQYNDNPPRVLITTPETYHELGREMYPTQKREKGQEIQGQTYREYLLEHGILTNIYETECLYTEHGTQDNALLINPSGDKQWIVQSQKINPFIWDSAQTGEWWCSLRQALTVAIQCPNTITEIQGITTQLTEKEKTEKTTTKRRLTEKLIKELNLTQEQYEALEEAMRPEN